MSKISYDQAFADHQYLWTTYGEAEDMTCAYVDQGDLARLLKSPTKATARDCLVSQIEYWFSAGPDPHGRNTVDPNDPELIEIADRYGETIPCR